ncbi:MULTISPECIES: TetR/AcrR family transcriptional regulator [Alphaproteobacteria]|uniref:TetR family transcriptional regulator n=2 Tax=Alphaproteobacteria TaxID=28211 RepID=A0A512HMR0_9HYPH|nr:MULTISPECIES: TetR/AcrR family transcriptional regulator [Alphaproteobacteria]GEO86744.1 TetR family transcriptional regulator [Ciceribacter naphthalenivorans]GLR20795.1 TetR family transcriptional regulator [Ciceribacter naphthalenivorans]GLT03651.1 TetR family transcriptional regulator [Sphingomonas psychrolutea]
MAEFSTDRRTRKDAQHNRTQILDVARQTFSSDGVDVSMDAIARQSGLGSATLYRHFPNKDALLAALLDEHYEDMLQKKTVIEAEESDAGRALERWIDALGDWMLVYDGLSEPLRAAWSRSNSPLKPTCQNLIDATDTFLRAAQGAGLAQPALTGRHIFVGALAVAWAGGTGLDDHGTRVVLRDLFKNGWGMAS